MKNILFFTFFLVFCCNSNSQKLDSIPVFEYEINYNLGKALVKKGYVFKYKQKIHDNTTKSVFLDKLSKFVEENKEGIPEINVRNGVAHENIIINIEKDSLFRETSAGSNPLVVKERLFNQNWETTGQQKVIN